MKQVIENVIKDFDFEKVHKAMVATNWTWMRSSDVPTINELILQAIELLREASKMPPEFSVSTGGFTATKHYDDECREGLSLEFILAESTFYENEDDE